MVGLATMSDSVAASPYRTFACRQSLLDGRYSLLFHRIHAAVRDAEAREGAMSDKRAKWMAMAVASGCVAQTRVRAESR